MAQLFENTKESYGEENTVFFCFCSSQLRFSISECAKSFPKNIPHLFHRLSRQWSYTMRMKRRKKETWKNTQFAQKICTKNLARGRRHTCLNVGSVIGNFTIHNLANVDILGLFLSPEIYITHRNSYYVS